MSERIVHLAGYSGRQPDDLLTVAQELDAVVFDIRFSPRSRRAEWSGKRLTNLMADRYRHVGAWGNLNFKGGPVQIADFAAGLAIFDATPGPIVLVCACKASARCHRTDVAHLLRAERGVRVVEIDWREIDRSVEIDQSSEIDQPDQPDRPRQMELGEPA